MITMYIPEGKTIDIAKEIMSARNIKDRETRNNTITGLNKIAQYI